MLPALPAVAGYTILGELGRGAMGVVYKARHVKLRRIVALKMILVDPATSPHYLARFEVEAEAVARLHHPNIVQIFEVGEHNGRPYLALEFVTGGTLHKSLSGRPQPIRAAVQLVATLGRAIHAAHQRGIVHRDIKPANILLEPSTVAEDWDGGSEGQVEAVQFYGVPKVADFGLAKRLDDDTPGRHGEVLGTPLYMAPEQANGRGEEVGPAADIYSLGSILYEMLTGRAPFASPTADTAMARAVAEEPTPPRALRKRLPRDLEMVCLRCLEKDPGKRYRSAQALADDLDRFLRGEPTRAHPPGPPKRLWGWSLRYPVPASMLVAVTVMLLLGRWWVPRLSDDIVLRTARAGAEQQAEIVMQNYRLYSEVIADLKKAYPQVVPTHKWSPGSVGVPIPARYTISLTDVLAVRADELKTNSDPGAGRVSSRIRIYSNYPFTRRAGNPPSKSSFAGRALVAYAGRRYEEGEESEPFIDDRLDPSDSGDRTYRYARPFVMGAACVDCHNNLDAYDAAYRENARKWQVGDVRGVLTVEIPLNSEYRKIENSINSTHLTFVMIGLGTLTASRIALGAARRRG